MNLEYHSEFQDVLEKYQISDRAKQVLDGLKLVLMVAPTSGGRNTIIKRKLQSGGYYYIVSDTTRPPRMNDGVLEQSGKEYWFRTEDQMLTDLKAGEFLEAELLHNQQVSGISIRELQKAKDARKVAITDVDLDGIHNVLRAKPDTIAIMLLPPSFDEWQRRLAGRGQMRPDEQRRRLETALKVFQDGLVNDCYHFIISEDIEQSAKLIDAIVNDKFNPHQGRGRSVLEHLKVSLEDRLRSAF